MSDKQLAFYDFSGGINTSATKVLLGWGAKKLSWDDSFNIELYKNNGVRRMSGNQCFIENEEGAGIIAICEYPKNTKGFIFAQADGKIKHYDNISKNVNLVTDFEKTLQSASFVPYLDGVVIVCDECESYYFNINASENLKPTNAKTREGETLYPNCGCTFASRLWFAKDSTVYFSALGRFDDWESENDAGYIANFHSSTAKITAMCPYCGSLAIFKTDGVYLLSGNSPSDFAIIKFADKGTMSPNAVCTCNNKQYFFNADGLFSLSQVGELSQIMMSGNIANNVKEDFTNCNRSQMHRAFCVPYEKNNQIWFYIPKNNSEFFSHILVFNFVNDCWTKRIEPQEILSATNINGEIYSGLNNGKILLENVSSRFENENINFKFLTPFFHLGKPSEKKIVEDFALLIEDNGENRFKFSTAKDFIKEEKYNEQYINVVQNGVLRWAKESDEKTNYNCWADTQKEIIWTKIVECSVNAQIFDSATSVAICIENQENGDDFKLIGIEFKELLNDE